MKPQRVPTARQLGYRARALRYLAVLAVLALHICTSRPLICAWACDGAFSYLLGANFGWLSSRIDGAACLLACLGTWNGTCKSAKEKGGRFAVLI